MSKAEAQKFQEMRAALVVSLAAINQEIAHQERSTSQKIRSGFFEFAMQQLKAKASDIEAEIEFVNAQIKIHGVRAEAVKRAWTEAMQTPVISK